MRTLLAQTIAATRPTTGASWLPGLPHALAALATWPVFGAGACFSALLLSSFVSFVVWLPLTALVLNDGKPVQADSVAPDLTANAKRALFVLWTATAWLVASVVQ
jgi:hypothetical protein